MSLNDDTAIATETAVAAWPTAAGHLGHELPFTASGAGGATGADQAYTATASVGVGVGVGLAEAPDAQRVARSQQVFGSHTARLNTRDAAAVTPGCRSR